MTTYIAVFQIKSGGTLKVTKVLTCKNFNEACKVAKEIVKYEFKNEFRIKSISEA